MAEAFVAVVSFALILVPLALLIYGIARTARHNVEAGSSLFGVLGGLVFVSRWLRPSFGARSGWDVATGPLIVIALGLLVCIAAQTLRVMQERSADERSRGTRV